MLLTSHEWICLIEWRILCMPSYPSQSGKWCSSKLNQLCSTTYGTEFFCLILVRLLTLGHFLLSILYIPKSSIWSCSFYTPKVYIPDGQQIFLEEVNKWSFGKTRFCVLPKLPCEQQPLTFTKGVPSDSQLQCRTHLENRKSLIVLNYVLKITVSSFISSHTIIMKWNNFTAI